MRDIGCWKCDCSTAEKSFSTTDQRGFLLGKLFFLRCELRMGSESAIVVFAIRTSRTFIFIVEDKQILE